MISIIIINVIIKMIKMTSVTDYLVQLQKLTKTNLEILKSINDSFLTKQEHLYTEVDGVKYVLPSFISLENKVNALEENFINLIHAPQTSEAYFNLDGGTREIVVKGYNSTPDGVSLNSVENFDIQKNNIFKDFLTPVPYINFALNSLPNDITSVNIKKIVPINDELVNVFKEKLTKKEIQDGKEVIIPISSTNFEYSDLYKILSLYKVNTDYVEYNTIKKLPIRKNIGAATYVIKSIVNDEINQYLENEITLQLRNDVDSPYSKSLTYKLFDQTIEKPLAIGDKITNYDGTGLAEIIGIEFNTNTIKVKVLNGDFMNFVPTENNSNLDQLSDLSKIRFYSTPDFDKDKYINVPLEEDQYVYIAIAPLNDRMNIQGPWGNGLMLNTFMLTNKNNVNQKFDDYYNNNVKNIGDILYEFTMMNVSSLNKISEEQFNNLTQAKPIINKNDILVLQINKHLSDSTTVKNIKSLYAQKKKYEIELQEIQSNIIDINKKLAEISFDDTSNLRTIYSAQLTEFNKKKNETITSITKIINEISLTVSNSDIPIENAKYRIRGFFNYTEFIKQNENIAKFLKNHIIGIKVQYRYKNLNNIEGSPVSMKDGFIFSDWNNMNSFLKKKKAKFDGGYEYEYDKSNYNEPSFNQIDIPISQGEVVDIKLKVVYDYGYPYTETTSDWSEIYTVRFPEEYLKDVKVLDIIEENNNDIETNRFNNILIEQGIPNHLNDKIIDQDITYFHKPESIASGFYTSERRIIPLKDKLEDLNNKIALLQDEIMGDDSALSVSIVNGNTINSLLPWQVNNISVEPYNSFYKSNNETDLIADGTYNFNSKNKVVTTLLNIVLENTSSHPIKLYSIFPGSRDVKLNDLKGVNPTMIDNYYYKNDDNIYLGVWLKSQTPDKNGEDLFLQTANQFITFRTQDAFTKSKYYSTDNVYAVNDQLSCSQTSISLNGSDTAPDGATMYPCVKDKFALCQCNDLINSYTIINSGQKLIIPIMFEYKLIAYDYFSKIMSFDLRTSLYKDPINYTFKVTAKQEITIQDKLISANSREVQKNTTKYNTTIN